MQFGPQHIFTALMTGTLIPADKVSLLAIFNVLDGGFGVVAIQSSSFGC